LERFDDAARDLERMLPVLSAPLHYLHLAYVHHKLGNDKRSQDAWLRAKQKGLKESEVPRLERDYFTALNNPALLGAVAPGADPEASVAADAVP